MKRLAPVALTLLTTTCTDDAPADLARDHAVAKDVASAAEAVQGVCERTPQVQNQIVRVTAAATCRGVTSQDLAGISTLNLNGAAIKALREGDFEGLSGLQSLDLGHTPSEAYPARSNYLTMLPVGVFTGLSSLESLNLSGNDLTPLAEGAFNELSRLQSLDLSSNGLTALSDRAFAGLASLQELNLSDNRLTPLPEGAFAGLSGLQSLDLSGNDLTALPAGTFAGLSRP
jgi:Leucine-rich repeat (LRR) protein